MIRKIGALLFACGLALGPLMPAALACGGLIAPNGAIRLERATTLVAWHDGIEHYLTSFSYQGDASNLGWIVPLPAVPDKVEEGGGWSLQRLNRETHPIAPTAAFDAAGEKSTASGVDVILQTKVRALDITVVRGSGQAIVDWATENGFTLDTATHGHLLAYANASPIFMAAKYDTTEAQKLNQTAGDGAPVLITMHVPHPWVPLEVLALDGQEVNADLYMMTDGPINTSGFGATIGQSPVGSEIPGAPGFKVSYQAKMNDALFSDLSTDLNMGWVWKDSWVTLLSLDAPAAKVTYDLSVSTNGIIRVAPYGTAPMAIAEKAAHDIPTWLPQLPIGTPQVMLGIVLVVGFWLAIFFIARRAAKKSVTPAMPTE